jgi:hypothetical protein
MTSNRDVRNVSVVTTVANSPPWQSLAKEGWLRH